MQIQFAEPIELAAVPGTTHFDAYGRRFTLKLAINEEPLVSDEKMSQCGRSQLREGKYILFKVRELLRS